MSYIAMVEQKEIIRIYEAVCEYFLFHNVMTDTDFDEICSRRGNK